jgi:G3E family GTPase
MSVPVTIVSGSFGVGKTRLLANAIAAFEGSLRVAVIKNELGALTIDECTIRRIGGEGVAVVESVAGCVCNVHERFCDILCRLGCAEAHDWIVIETSALTDPAVLLPVFFTNDEVSRCFVLDAMVTVVNAATLKATTCATEFQSGESRALMRQIEFADRIVLNRTGGLDKHALKDIKKTIRRFNPSAPIICTEDGTVVPSLIKDIPRTGFRVMRFMFAHPGLFSVNVAHIHATDTLTVALSSNEPLNCFKVEQWVNLLTKTCCASSIFRIKGVINAKGSDDRFVVDSFYGAAATMRFSDPWGTDEPRKKMLLICGRDLDLAAIRKDFSCCVAEASLRFRLHAPVEANVHGKGWMAGTVIRHWDEGNAYRVKLLHDQSEVWAPMDRNAFIRSTR